MTRSGLAGDGTVRIKMGRQQLIHGLDRLAGEGDLGIDNRIDQHGTAVEPAAELLFAPRLPEGISRDHIEDHVGIHEAHPGVGNRPHCSRISWGMVTWPLLVIRMVRRAATPVRILLTSGCRLVPAGEDGLQVPHHR